MAEATLEERVIASYQSKDGQEIKLSFDNVRKFLVSGKSEFVTEQELMFFIGTCKSRGLNPFKKDCYLIKYAQNDPAAIVVSIDYYRSRAKAQADCVGWSSGIIIETVDGTVTHRSGSFIRENETLLGGWFKAKPKGWDEYFEWSIPLKPFVKKTSQGGVTRFWSDDNQPYMIAKVAESQGLRRLWPDEFQQLYIKEELHAGPRDITPEPLKIPQSLKEKPDVRYQKPDATDTADGARANENAVGAQTQQERPVHEDAPNGSKETKAPAKDSEDEPSPKQIALTWVASLTKESFPNPSALNPFLKGLSVSDQTAVCARFNERKKELNLG